MSAASWGLVVPTQGSPIVPIRTPFITLAESVASALDKLDDQSFIRVATRSALPSSGNVMRQHATVYADPTVANNGDYFWNGSTWNLAQAFTSGKTDVNSNSSSYQNINHGLGKEPARVFCQVYGVRTARELTVRITNTTATDFQVAWWYDGAAYANQSGTGQGIYWRAEA